MDEETFRQTVADIANRCAREGCEITPHEISEIQTAAIDYADTDRPEPDGSESCMGPCCGGTI